MHLYCRRKQSRDRIKEYWTTAQALYLYIPRSGSSTRFRLTLGKKAVQMECKDKPKVN